MWRAIYHEFRGWAKTFASTSAANRRTEITAETHRVWIIRRSPGARAWCAECGREVDVVGSKEMAALKGLGQPLHVEAPCEPEQQKKTLKENDNEKR